MQEPGQVQRGSGEGSEGCGEGLGLWCRARFNRVPEKASEKVTNSVSYRGLQPRKAPVCTGAGAGSGSTRFRRRFRRLRRRSGALVQSQVRFNRVPEKASEKVTNSVSYSGLQPRKAPVCTGAGAGSGSREGSGGCREGLGGFGAEPVQVQQGSGEGFGEGLGGFGAEPGQVQQGSGSGEGSGVGAKPGQVQQDSKVPKKVPEKVPGGFGAGPSQVQQGSGEGSGGSGEGSGRLWCRDRSSSAGFPEKVWEALVQSQVRFNRVQ